MARTPKQPAKNSKQADRTAIANAQAKAGAAVVSKDAPHQPVGDKKPRQHVGGKGPVNKLAKQVRAPVPAAAQNKAARRKLSAKQRDTALQRAVLEQQQTVEFAIRKLPFQRFVREIVQNEYPDGLPGGDGDIKFQGNALIALQEAVEHELIDVFENANRACIHAKRKQVHARDVLFDMYSKKNAGVPYAHEYLYGKCEKFKVGRGVTLTNLKGHAIKMHKQAVLAHNKQVDALKRAAKEAKAAAAAVAAPQDVEEDGDDVDVDGDEEIADDA